MIFITSSVIAETRFSDLELMQMLKNDGYSAVELKKEGVIAIKIDGKGYILSNLKDGDIQFTYYLSGANISFEDINEWNHTKRLSRAYLDSDKDLALETDLMSNGGISKENVLAAFRIFVNTSVSDFRKFVVDHNKS